MELITIYAPHHFNGEYNFSELIKDPKSRFWFAPDVEIHGPTVEIILEVPGINLVWADFIKEKFPTLVEYIGEELENIICFQYYKEQITAMEIGYILHANASEIMDKASGDDDFFDYCPGAVNAIICILNQLGEIYLSENLKEQLELRGHYN